MLRKKTNNFETNKYIDNMVIGYGVDEVGEEIVIVDTEQGLQCAYGTILNFTYGTVVEEEVLMPLTSNQYKVG